MEVKHISIDEIDLSVRCSNALHRIGVHTVGEMVQHNEESLSQVRNLGQKSVQEILLKIKEYKHLESLAYIPMDTASSDGDTAAGEKQTILEWLLSEQIRVDVLTFLSAKAYNFLLLNEQEYLHQIAFRTAEYLQEAFHMDATSASEIAKWTDVYIQENKKHILDDARRKAELAKLTLFEMRTMPEYQEKLTEYVSQNDIPIDGLFLSNRPKNQLQRNGYQTLSDIICIPKEKLRDIPSMGSLSVDEIISVIQDYLEKYETRILAYVAGDVSALWDSDAIKEKILALYQDAPFSGFSLAEMTDLLALPSEISSGTLKQTIGSLLEEKKLEYVDFRCYRIYDSFESFLPRCDSIDERASQMLKLRLEDNTLDEVGKVYGVTRERVRQIVAKSALNVQNQHFALTGDQWFDEDYYRYFFETYAFDRRDASRWLGIPETVWKYFEMLDVKQGKKNLDSALDDHENLEIGLRLKIKNYLNRNKIFIDGRWIEKHRSDLENIVAEKICQDDLSFDQFAKKFNEFLAEEEIPYNEDIYYTDDVIRTRKNRLSDSKFILWKQNEMLRYYDIDSRDYTELLDTLKLDSYENVDYSTLKFVREYPELMAKYDIRDHYELHNLLRKIVPEGSYHDFHCSRTPVVKFGSFDRDAAILDIIRELSPVSVSTLCERIADEYGYDSNVTWANYLRPFDVYYHDGIYRVDQKVMRPDRLEALHHVLTDDFYYIDEIRKTYANLFPDADLDEINPYNLKSMGFSVLSKYVIQNYVSLEAYCEDLLTKDDIVDIKPLRQRLTYVQAFSVKLMELKRNLDVIEFESGKILNFRKLARAGITKDDLREFCNAVYDFIPEGSYFTAHSLKVDGFESDLYDLGFSDWFYGNLLLSDDRFSFIYGFTNLIFYKGKKDITLQTFLVDRVCDHGWIDFYDLVGELEDRYGCQPDKYDIPPKLKNTQIYRDKDLDRFYANVDLYYRDLDETGGF